MTFFSRVWIKNLASLLVFLLLFLSSGVYWLGNSKTGLNWLLEQVEYLAPGKLIFGQARGRLFSEFIINDIYYKQEDGLEINLYELKISWQAIALIYDSLNFNQVTLENIIIKTAEIKADPQTKNKPFKAMNISSIPTIEFPIYLFIDKLSLNKIELQIRQTDKSINSIKIDQFNLQNVNFKKNLIIGQASLVLAAQKNIPELAIEWKNKLLLSPPYTSNLELLWKAEFPKDHFPEEHLLRGLNSQGKLTANGNPENYQLNIETQLQTQQLPNSVWKLQGNGDLSKFSVNNLTATLLGGEITSHGLVYWQPEIKADVEVDMKSLHLNQLAKSLSDQIPLSTPIDSHGTMSYYQNQLDIEDFKFTLPQTEAVIQINGKVEQITTLAQANLNVQWHKIQWPIDQNQPIITSQQGTVSIQGGADNYSLFIDTQLGGKDLPISQWQGQIEGDLHSIQSLEFNGQVLSGQIQLHGNSDWSEQAKWNISLQGKGLRPEEQWPEFPGLLDFDIQHEGKMTSKGLAAHVVINQFKGKIKGYPVNLQADLISDGHHHQLSKLDFYSGKNHISGIATITSSHSINSPEIDAKFSINAPKLETFLPNAKGEIIADGIILGDLKQPKILTKVRGNAVTFNQWQLDSFKSELDFNPQQDGKLKLKADVSEIKKQNKIVINKLSLTSNGKLKNHQIDLKIKSAQESLAMQLRGGWNLIDSKWSGQLNKLKLKSSLVGDWSLVTSGSLLLSEHNIDLNLSCLQASEHKAKLCSSINWKKGQLVQAKMELEQFSLSQFFKSTIPPEISMTGLILNAQIDATLLENKEQIQLKNSLTENKMDIKGDIKLSLSPGEILALREGKQYFVPFKGAELKANIGKMGLKGQLDSQFFDKSSLSATFSLANFKHFPLDKNQPISADLKTQILDLDLLPGLVPVLKNTSGFIDMNMDIGGDLNSPELKGQLDLQANTDIPDLGLQLKEIKTQISTDKSNKKLNIIGSLKSGEGFNQFDGALNLENFIDWNANLNVVGEMFKVIDTNDFKVWLSPDVSLKIKADELEIAGLLKIPKALLTPQVNIQANTSRINSSNDVIIVDEEIKNPDVQKKSFKITGQLEAILGDDIRIDVADFKSSMQGKVKMVFDHQYLIPKGQGELNIIDGTYKAYGQDLEISQGRLFFQGTPMDNTGLGIRAIRRIKNNTFNAVDVAGVDIRGTAKSPLISLFSEPKVSDADILSYIISGSPISGNSIEGQALSLGTYIRPSFYVSLAYDLFEDNKSFNLRYDISNKWGIEGLVGDRDSGVDISFTLRR